VRACAGVSGRLFMSVRVHTGVFVFVFRQGGFEKNSQEVGFSIIFFSSFSCFGGTYSAFLAQKCAACEYLDKFDYISIMIYDAR